jgi:hypothetical protein
MLRIYLALGAGTLVTFEAAVPRDFVSAALVIKNTVNVYHNNFGALDSFSLIISEAVRFVGKMK